ncbi:unnamed protein product [Rotaria magnacalcarata]|uniref:Gluconokinase n=1 Tax=Rotaria magnacalcarata TaxID=392030 RepID=A0A814FD16_9BILA|nr:unnamed protein product [Rotaria magnacalcarata]CAF1614289.1 unnamed protein product [Rotaria magnacalcarata]CAF1937225.1 unnamed protein product [Rotaria magnacalcarata]CAF1942545.1 unnamed protein product [Rotaria magnacalcarata]CAF3820687.1 unnamed protein product [Rotaria magnacalcarata]
MPVIVLGGVTAVGKTTTAKQLKDQYNWDYIEGDQYHPMSNIAKMQAGIPLTDEDRLPWLMLLHEKLKNYLTTNQSCIITCSALKSHYRQILLTGSSDPNVKVKISTESVYIIILTSSKDILHDRLLQRQNSHFMNPSLLDSQLQTLQLPANQTDEPYTYIINCDNHSQNEIINEIQQIIKQ